MKIIITVALLTFSAHLPAEPLSKVITDVLPFSVDGERWQAEFHKVPIDEKNEIFCSTGIAVYRSKAGVNEVITYEFKNDENLFCEDVEFTRYRFTPDGDSITLPVIEEFSIQVLEDDGSVLMEAPISSYERENVVRTAKELMERISNQAAHTTPAIAPR